jgi:hypothetical protein
MDIEKVDAPQGATNKVNLLDLVEPKSTESSLETVRLGSDETAIIPFTAEGHLVNVHY